MKIKLLLLFITLFFIASLKVSAQTVSVQDSLALVDLYDSTGGTGWINHTNWLTSAPVSSWYGIQVNYGSISFIQLNNNHLVGKIPSSIGNITGLNYLDLQQNQLSGTIPASFGNFQNLWALFLNYNQLTGKIPSSLINLPKFTTINLSYNKFTFSGLEGLITAGFTNTFIITYTPQADIPLIKNRNILSVSVGGTLSNNTFQWYKDGTAFTTKTGDSTLTITSDAQYSVTVTNKVAKGLTLYSISTVNTQDSLALVDLYNSTNGNSWINNTNWLSTEPVNNWYGVTARNGRVTDLELFSNNLKGLIPISIGNLTSLNRLSLDVNQLTGSIPSAIGNLSVLSALGLSNNKLTSGIPSTIKNLSNIQVLSLNGNQLSGSIPQSIGNLSSLVNLYLSNNKFTGVIPSSLGELYNLSELHLNDNQLEGSIPASLGNDKKLIMIELANNQLTGDIPDSLKFLTQLARLEINNNQLIGSIPTYLNDLPQLFSILLNNNKFSGSFPSLSKLTISNFDISNNAFTFSGMESLPLGREINIYAPQANISLIKHEDLLSVSAGGTLANDTFRLYKDGVLTATKIGDSIFSITNTGRYSISVTNTIATQLTLYSDSLTIGITLADTTSEVTMPITGNSTTDVNNGTFKLISITPTSGANALNGSVATTVTIDQAVSLFHDQPYVQRHYDITPVVNAGTAQATVTLYFTQQDFDNFNSYVTSNNIGIPLLPTDGINNGNLRIIQLHGSFTASPDPGNYNDQTAVVISPTVVWDNANNWWIVTFPVTGFSGFFVSTANFTLPLTLLEFKGKQQVNSVMLQWLTTNEIFTKEFAIERGSDEENFKQIGKVTANSLRGINSYSFIDESPLPGNNFYRLRMIDIDGKISFSNILIETYKSNIHLFVYPNPVNNDCKLVFSNTSPGKYIIEITDQTDRLINRINGVSIAGKNQITIDMSRYARGEYYITLITNRIGKYSLKLNKQ